MTATRVFLVGPRGSGKTTVARLLAAELGWAWVDADVLLEARAGLSIRDIFAAEGEAGFRRREADMLAELCALESHVIATGGGVVLRAENRALLKRSGVVVWLTGDIDTLWGRITADATTAARRPTLTVGGRAEVAELVAAREPLYRECADVVIDTTGRSPGEIVEAVKEGIRGTEENRS
jgi:shikimate kinase